MKSTRRWSGERWERACLRREVAAGVALGQKRAEGTVQLGQDLGEGCRQTAVKDEHPWSGSMIALRVTRRFLRRFLGRPPRDLLVRPSGRRIAGRVRADLAKLVGFSRLA